MDSRKFGLFMICITGGILLMMLMTGRNSVPVNPATPTTAPSATASGSATPATGAGDTTAAIVPFAENDTLNYRLGSLDPASGFKFQIDLVNEGASIVDVQLSEYYATAKDKRLAEKLKNEQAYQQEVAKSNGEYLGHYIAQTPVGWEFRTEGLQGQLVKTLENFKRLLKEKETQTKAAEERNRNNPSYVRPQTLTQQLGVHLPLATHAVVQGPNWGQTFADARWIIDRNATKATKDSQSVAFYVAVTQGGKEIFRLTKTYTVKVNDYSVHVTLEAQNSSGQELSLRLDQGGPSNLVREDVRSDERQIALGRRGEKVAIVKYNLFDGSLAPKGVNDLAKDAPKEKLKDIEKVLLYGNMQEKETFRPYFPDGLPTPVVRSLAADKDPRKVASIILPDGTRVTGEPDYRADVPWYKKLTGGTEEAWAQFYRPLGRSDSNNGVIWVGQLDKFFASFMYVRGVNAKGQEIDPPPTEYRAFEQDQAPEYRTVAQMEAMRIAPGQSRKLEINLFSGPRNTELFKTTPLYANLDYQGTIDTGNCCGLTFFGLVPLLTDGLMWLLEHLGVWVGNYGIAIIILVIIIRVLLHPLTKKGQVSMSKMQKLGPQLAALKEKYKDDKESLQRETMKFYREQGASPIVGCLPMFLQMPIWIALYSAFSADVNLRHASFLPFWITDLSGQDAIFSWPNHAFTVPLMGTIVSFNLLPILLTIAMYYQTKLTPTSMGTPTTPQQAQQQKMMKYMMPVMMLLFFYNAPAGLNLYIMTSTFSSVFEQMIIRKHIQEKEAAEAAAETQVDMPGKAARGARPKKPKGPFWTKRG